MESYLKLNMVEDTPPFILIVSKIEYFFQIVAYFLPNPNIPSKPYLSKFIVVTTPKVK